MEGEPSNYALFLVIGFVIMVVLVTVSVCGIVICCLTQTYRATDDRATDVENSEDFASNYWDILPRSQGRSLHALLDAAKLMDRRISDQLNL